MKYRVRSSGELKTQGELRKLNPNMSLPKVWNDSVLEALDVDAVRQLDVPDYNVAIEKAELNSSAEQVDGEWVQGWTVSTMTAEEKAAKDAAKAETERQQRNALLQETDWMAMSDTTLSTEWASYRQLLRDVPAQSGFPYTITWPSEPE